MSVLFASQDCSVVVLDIDDAASRRLVDGLCNDGRRAAYFHCDVTDIDALQRLYARSSRLTGPSTCWSTMPRAMTGRTC
jgi:NAD(P)-dependent dehydrogenase (short-subunit alcohol dehydrogenase family)